jgi:hypothetical protein
MMRRASARKQIKSSFSSWVRWCGLASESPEPGVHDYLEQDAKLSHRKLGRTVARGQSQLGYGQGLRTRVVASPPELLLS